MDKLLFNKLAVFAFLCLALNASIFAQETDTAARTRESISLAPFGEAVFYGRHSPAIGGGLALGYGDRSVIGISGFFASSVFDGNSKIHLLEILAFLRFFVFRGFFIQLNTGMVVLYAGNSIYFPADAGSFSVGISAGWQFMLGRIFYIEPYLRGGYPYFGGAGVSLGFKF